jgi:uncharacterized protein YqgC (DUF456 family)
MTSVIFDIAALVLLTGVCLVGVILTVTQLPGTWIIVAASAGYAWFTEAVRIGWRTVLIVVCVAVLAEIFEVAGGAVVARRGGASRRAAWYGLIGGILGAFLLTVPIFLVGTVIGAVIGCFAGAFIAEMQEGRSIDEGTRSGLYSAMGRALGSIAKVLAAVVMSSIVIVSATMSFFR